MSNDIGLVTSYRGGKNNLDKTYKAKSKFSVLNSRKAFKKKAKK